MDTAFATCVQRAAAAMRMAFSVLRERSQTRTVDCVTMPLHAMSGEGGSTDRKWGDCGKA